MKNLIIAITLLIPTCVCAQSLKINSSDNFYDVIKRNMTLYATDSSEGGTCKQLERMNKIWGERLSPHGDFTIAANAIYIV